jgi:hypothetical protein
VKYAWVWPAAMVTVAGTVAADLFEVKVTTAPPGGAASDRTTELFAIALPPTTVEALIFK